MDQNNNQKNKKNNGMVLISLFFLIWFVLSLVAMIYFAKKGQGAVSVMVLGQFLLCFGIVCIIASISDKTFNSIILLFPVSGIGCIIGGAIYQFGTETVIAETEKMLPDIVGGIFLIAGIIMVIARFIRSGKKKRLCTAPVTATCVNIESRFRRGHKSICPTYEISYRDEMIRLCNNTFTSLNPKCQVRSCLFSDQDRESVLDPVDSGHAVRSRVGPDGKFANGKGFMMA